MPDLRHVSVGLTVKDQRRTVVREALVLPADCRGTVRLNYAIAKCRALFLRNPNRRSFQKDITNCNVCEVGMDLGKPNTIRYDELCKSVLRLSVDHTAMAG